MSEPCSSCDALRKTVEALNISVGELSREKSDLEEQNSLLSREEVDARDAADYEEELRDKAEEAKDQAVAELREEKALELAMLRRLEWTLHGLCPLCHGVVQHKTGCDMKLAIFRLDHEIHRTEYVHR